MVLILLLIRVIRVIRGCIPGTPVQAGNRLVKRLSLDEVGRLRRWTFELDLFEQIPISAEFDAPDFREAEVRDLFPIERLGKVADRPRPVRQPRLQCSVASHTRASGC